MRSSPRGAGGRAGCASATRGGRELATRVVRQERVGVAGLHLSAIITYVRLRDRSVAGSSPGTSVAKRPNHTPGAWWCGLTAGGPMLTKFETKSNRVRSPPAAGGIGGGLGREDASESCAQARGDMRSARTTVGRVSGLPMGLPAVRGRPRRELVGPRSSQTASRRAR
jgi:hypothetical protein